MRSPRNWWLEVLRGVAAIIFGILAFAWPGITLLTLVLFWGAFALVDGVLAIAAAVKGGNPMPRWWLAIVGIAGIVAGVLTFLMPGLTALVLLTFIAVWAIVLGVMEIYGAIKLRKEIEGEWFLILNGALSVAVRHRAAVAAGHRRARAGLDHRRLRDHPRRHLRDLRAEAAQARAGVACRHGDNADPSW